MNDDRIEDIEAKIAHQELAIAKMSELIYGQQQQLDLLTTRYKGLLDRFRELSENHEAGEAPGDMPPPHY